MPLVTVQELIDAGVHYGHQASRWNPKMKPFIYGKRHRIHIINLQETIRGLLSATHFLRSLAATGAQIMFLGTKRQIRTVVESEAKRCGMPAITERWIGGTLTNFSTVREQLTRLEELEAMEADGTMERHKKKAQSTLRREMRKISRNLEGVRDLHGLPGAIVVIDPRREEIAIREAARMNVPVVCILDTDCDPSNADIVIPGNDDAMSSVALLMGRLADAVSEGRAALDPQTLAEAERTAREDIRCKPVIGRQQTQRGGASGRRDGQGGRGGGGGGGRGGRGGPGGGGRLARGGAGGRFAQASGHASSVSIGGESEGAAPAAADAAKADAPKADAPKAEAPAETPAKAPEAPAAETPKAETPKAESPNAESPKAKPPEAGGDKPAE